MNLHYDHPILLLQHNALARGLPSRSDEAGPQTGGRLMTNEEAGPVTDSWPLAGIPHWIGTPRGVACRQSHQTAAIRKGYKCSGGDPN
jgi:hypothetical protein